MAEDQGDKTEAPTPRKRQEAREQGNIPRSMDLSSAAILLGGILLLNWWGEPLVRALVVMMRSGLSGASVITLDGLDTLQLLTRHSMNAALALAPLLLGLFVVGILANVVQVGLLLNGKKLQPNFGAVNPIKGVGRLFKGGQGLFRLAMGLTKVAVTFTVAYHAIKTRLPAIIDTQNRDFTAVFLMGAMVVYDIAIKLGVLLLVLALIDYVYERFRIGRELRMTKQEVKDEMRRMEGDPQIRQRRRQIQQQLAMKRLKSTVPRADVVVTNPTEFAVALRYDPATMTAPRVVAKGRDLMAARIREIAIASGVPILERKPLARALYRMVEVGGEIPEQFYAAVAEILAYVYEISGKAGRRKQAPAAA